MDHLLTTVYSGKNYTVFDQARLAQLDVKIKRMHMDCINLYLDKFISRFASFISHLRTQDIHYSMMVYKALFDDLNALSSQLSLLNKPDQFDASSIRDLAKNSHRINEHCLPHYISLMLSLPLDTGATIMASYQHLIREFHDLRSRISKVENAEFVSQWLLQLNQKELAVSSTFIDECVSKFQSSLTCPNLQANYARVITELKLAHKEHARFKKLTDIDLNPLHQHIITSEVQVFNQYCRKFMNIFYGNILKGHRSISFYNNFVNQLHLAINIGIALESSAPHHDLRFYSSEYLKETATAFLTEYLNRSLVNKFRTNLINGKCKNDDIRQFQEDLQFQFDQSIQLIEPFQNDLLPIPMEQQNFFPHLMSKISQHIEIEILVKSMIPIKNLSDFSIKSFHDHIKQFILHYSETPLDQVYVVNLFFNAMPKNIATNYLRHFNEEATKEATSLLDVHSLFYLFALSKQCHQNSDLNAPFMKCLTSLSKQIIPRFSSENRANALFFILLQYQHIDYHKPHPQLNDIVNKLSKSLISRILLVLKDESFANKLAFLLGIIYREANYDLSLFKDLKRSVKEMISENLVSVVFKSPNIMVHSNLQIKSNLDACLMICETFLNNQKQLANQNGLDKTKVDRARQSVRDFMGNAQTEFRDHFQFHINEQGYSVFLIATSFHPESVSNQFLSLPEWMNFDESFLLPEDHDLLKSKLLTSLKELHQSPFCEGLSNLEGIQSVLSVPPEVVQRMYQFLGITTPAHWSQFLATLHSPINTAQVKTAKKPAISAKRPSSTTEKRPPNKKRKPVPANGTSGKSIKPSSSKPKLAKNSSSESLSLDTASNRAPLESDLKSEDTDIESEECIGLPDTTPVVPVERSWFNTPEDGDCFWSACVLMTLNMIYNKCRSSGSEEEGKLKARTAWNKLFPKPQFLQSIKTADIIDWYWTHGSLAGLEKKEDNGWDFAAFLFKSAIKNNLLMRLSQKKYNGLTSQLTSAFKEELYLAASEVEKSVFFSQNHTKSALHPTSKDLNHWLAMMNKSVFTAASNRTGWADISNLYLVKRFLEEHGFSPDPGTDSELVVTEGNGDYVFQLRDDHFSLFIRKTLCEANWH